MLALAGCVQPALAPGINAAAARVLDRLGISLVEAPGAGCCGAVRFHLNRQEAGKSDAKALIDAWWPRVESGVEAIVMTASGCGTMVKEFGHLLQEDADYAKKAQRISAMTVDLGQVLASESVALEKLLADQPPAGGKIAFHSPCSLQHGQQIRGVIEPLLEAAGFELTHVADPHLCCGSAGTYSVLQPDLSERLLAGKLAALEAGEPAEIVTANIGCLSHLQSGTQTRVEHWIEVIDRCTSGQS
jgi:glycolate oxidase iron-sulfur subunit